ncbi:hypothetical protein C5O22_01440 [Treponema sp. J25]|nr:hypothetical protein C5O22_01440 [Treponema sp. J25]
MWFCSFSLLNKKHPLPKKRGVPEFLLPGISRRMTPEFILFFRVTNRKNYFLPGPMVRGKA